MKHYDYHIRLEALWQKAVDLYQNGQRGADSYFSPEEVQWLMDNGITPQEIYDFAEDYVSSGEPNFTSFALVTDIRRNHFLDKLGGKCSSKKRDPATYPPKDAGIDGIRWLPRIIEKAKDKLAGHLDADTMYGCGGDRKFLKEHDIGASEFLRKVAEANGNDHLVIEWVKARSAALNA